MQQLSAGACHGWMATHQQAVRSDGAQQQLMLPNQLEVLVIACVQQHSCSLRAYNASTGR
jgi:hypothetical protein